MSSHSKESLEASLGEQRGVVVSKFVEAISAVDGVRAIVDHYDPFELGDHILFVIADESKSYEARQLEINHAVEALGLNNEQLKLIGSTPAICNDFIYDLDTFGDTIWSSPDTEVA